MSDIQMREQPAAREKTCARCGTVFGCRAETGGCWCADEPVYLPMPPAGVTDDCMCPTCLRAETAKRQLGPRAV